MMETVTIKALAIPPHMTGAVSADQLVVSESVDPSSLRRLLGFLAQEDCVHSWRNFGPEGTLEALLEWENVRRPTKLFFFHLKRGDEMQLVAASAVADQLNWDYPDPGFCVLGRCYIMPAFRSLGLYRSILSYRLEYCRARFGSKLNAIHIGAISDRISRVITNHRLPGWSRFVHIGQEKLGVAGESKEVGAYLMFLPGYLRRMQAALAGADAPAGIVELRNALTISESAPVRDLGVLVKQVFEDEEGCEWLEGRDTHAFEQLLTFCRAVPLIGFPLPVIARGSHAELPRNCR